MVALSVFLMIELGVGEVMTNTLCEVFAFCGMIEVPCVMAQFCTPTSHSLNSESFDP
jgi:hypothetical protein